MKKSLKYLIFFLISACVSPYNVTPDYRPAIVIQGLITDQPGPYLVTVYTTVPISLQQDESGAVTGATVIIKDDVGNSETLKEQSEGQYYTSAMQGVIGRSYTISVTTSEGYSYESTQEKLNAVGDFTNITTEFEQNEGVDANDQISSTNGFNVYIDSEVLPEQEGRVWWRWNGTFHSFTYPSLRVKAVTTMRAIVLIPDPVPCSGFISHSGVLVQTGPCTCCDCWYTRYNQAPIISNPNIVSHGSINHFNVAFVEVNRRTFYEKYYLEIEQLSVSPSVYEFWKLVSIQKSNSSNLFQVTPPKAIGNLSATSKGALPVIGYFAASASIKHTITLDQTDLPSNYKLLQIDSMKISCMDLYPNSTNVKPLFW